MKNKGLQLVVFYWIGIILIFILSYLTLYNDLILWTSLFTVTLIINRISLDFSKIKETAKFLYFSEVCFVAYIILLFVLKNNHFTLYKLLIIPSVVLSIYYIFKFKRVKKERIF